MTTNPTITRHNNTVEAGGLRILSSRCRKPKLHILIPMFISLILLPVRFFGERNSFFSSSTDSSSSVSRSSSKGTISCPRFQFPKRTTLNEEEDFFLAQSNQTIAWVQEVGLTFLKEDALSMHQQLLNQIEVQGIPGMIVECGVAKAGSAITFAAIKHPQRCLHLFDTFEGIPEPSAKDGEDVQERYRKIQIDKQNCQQGLATCHKDYYGNMDDLLAFDQRQFELAGYPPSGNEVFFHQGLFDDTVWPAGPIAYAHLDGDWYDSTYHMLERISPFLSEGGYFVLDDVYQWSGAKNAYIDFFQVDLTWLQEQQQQQQPQQPDGNTSKKPPCCWTMVVTKETGAKRYYHLVLGVRAMAQAISSKTAEQLGRADTVPQCIPPPNKTSPNTTATMTHSKAT